MARTIRPETPHTGWCARDHRCGVTEHRAPPVIADHLGARAIVTRVRAGDVEYAEITARIPLARHDALARRQVGLTLHLLRRLFAAVAAVRPETLPTAPARPALDRRTAA
ncbi:hypothetical protein ACQP2F_40985 [Actinoplanes sp. CA-030573]|uniref:hypothetical protein n=1 Tax=Actinoplanes sp. CA-030573 TaxID=3239898 RepID=UPI003D8EEBBF